MANQDFNLIRSSGGGDGDVSRLEAKVDGLLYALGNPQTPTSDSGGLLPYWLMISRRKLTVLFVALLGAVAGYAVSLRQTPTYLAGTSLEMVDLSGRGLSSARVNAATPSQSPETYLQTQLSILQSRLLINRVVKKLDEGRQASKANPLPSNLADHIAENLNVEVARGTKILKISYASPDPQLASDVVNTTAAEYIQQDIEGRIDNIATTRDWLSRELDAVKGRLEASEYTLQRYAKATDLVVDVDKDGVTQSELRRVAEELSRAQALRMAAQSQYEIASTKPVESLPEVLDYVPLREYQVKIMDLRRELAALSSSLTPAHYKVQRVQAQIVELESSMAKERATILSRIRNEYDTAARREALLTSEYQKQTRIVGDKSAKSIHYNVLKREVEVNRNLYESLLQSIKEAGVNLALRDSNARVIDPAEPPRTRYRPKPLLNSAIGLLAGLLIGVMSVLVTESRDRKLRDPDASAVYLNLPELGVIPSFDSAPDRPRRLRNMLLRGSGSPELVRSGTFGLNDPISSEVVNHGGGAPLSVAEAYRSTLTSILFSGKNGSRPRVIVVSSPGPDEGKSSMVSNLGIALAEINHKVLLIGADLRNPRLHSMFRVPNAQGLSSILRSQTPVTDGMLESMTHKTAVPNLYVLPSGPKTVSTSNLLHSDRMREMIRAFRSEFDTIVIDTPPVLLFSDARVLARVAETVVLVIRSGHTTRDAAIAAKKRLHDDGTHILGTVLNDWNGEYTDSAYNATHYADTGDAHSRNT